MPVKKKLKILVTTNLKKNVINLKLSKSTQKMKTLIRDPTLLVF